MSQYNLEERVNVPTSNFLKRKIQKEKEKQELREAFQYKTQKTARY